MGKAKDQKGFHSEGSARSEALKALIVPFDILYSIIATGVMQSGKDFSAEDQEITLGCLGTTYGVVSLAFLVINLIVYGCKANKNDKCCTGRTECCNWCCTGFKKKILKLIYYVADFVFVIGTNIVYLVGDSMTEVSPESTPNRRGLTPEERDLTVKSILFLISAIILFNLWEPIKTLFEISNKLHDKRHKATLKEDESKEDDNTKCEKQNIEVGYHKAIVFATVRTLSLVPETDATYTALANLVRLTRDNCRPRKYNILWIMYGAIIINITIKFVSAFLRAFSKSYDKNGKNWNKNLGCWISYAVITSIFAILSTGCFFVVDNELPLDCSQHFRLTNMERALEKKNYNFRIAFLVVSWVFSVTILIMGGICWGRYLCLYWNEKDLPLDDGDPSEDPTPATPEVRTTATPRDLTRPVSDIDILNPRNSMSLTQHTPSIQESMPQELDGKTSMSKT